MSDLSHRCRVAGHYEMMPGMLRREWFRPLRPEEAVKVAELRAAGMLAHATHVMLDGEPVPIEAPAAVAAPAAAPAPAAPAKVYTAEEIAEMERRYDARQREWEREQVSCDPSAAAWIENGGQVSLDDLKAADFLIGAMALAFNEDDAGDGASAEDRAAADLLISALHGFAANTPTNTKPAREERRKLGVPAPGDGPAPTGPAKSKPESDEEREWRRVFGPALDENERTRRRRG